MILYSLLMLFLKRYRISSALLVIKDLVEKSLVCRIYYYSSFNNDNSCKTNSSLWYRKSQFVVIFVIERELKVIHISAQFAILVLLKKPAWKYILIQLMKTKSHIKAQFVIIFVPENVIWNSILNQFMITRS